MRRDVAVIILAGGEGRRIGGRKPLRRFDRDRLIDRALRAARSWSDLVALAVRDGAQVELVDAEIIQDDAGVEGPLAGLIAGLRFARTAGRSLVLTIPADMPFLPPDLVDRLLPAIGGQGCAIASSGGHLHPVCALWQTSAAEHFGSYLAGRRRSLKGFAALIGFREVEWATRPHDPFFNINSAADLAEAKRRIAN